ncbi:hypothetical protein [Sphingomonas rustica]|uniref:hypothetical protein n=1 Tax=Sphingomonas rustica TaxID=3103142 RepID=UPI0031FCE367
MNAGRFSRAPQRASQDRAGTGSATRRIHRWVGVIFTLTVTANFAAMAFGPPPAWVTYAPLAPLLFLWISGMTMLVSLWWRGTRGDANVTKGAA